jgi:Iron-containing redox enzyme
MPLETQARLPAGVHDELAHPHPINHRLAFHYLVNCDEHPEVLPDAVRLVRNKLQARAGDASAPPLDFGSPEDISALESSLATLRTFAELHARPWQRDDLALTRRQVMHYLTQFLPTALVDGCWLHGALRVGTAHTEIGAAMTVAYAHQVEAAIDDHEQRFIGEYRNAYGRLAGSIEEASSRALSERREIHDASFAMPALLLAIGQFPRTFLPEIAGIHLAWLFLDLAAFGRQLLADARVSHGLPVADRHHWRSDDGHALGMRIARSLVASDVREGSATWRRLHGGLALFVEMWSGWLASTAATAPIGVPSARQEMIELLCRKAPHAAGYHGERRLAGTRLDDRFRAARFDPSAFLDDLARSPLIAPGRPEDSRFLQELVVFGGPMFTVFSPAELTTIRNWIASLSQERLGESGEHAGDNVTISGEAPPVSPEAVFSPNTFQRRSEERDRRCTVRELFHRLVNRESFPEVLPVAERFARARVRSALSTMTAGERAIPSVQYDPKALEAWVHHKHRQQIDSYRPLTGAPRVSRKAFVESSVQLAPLILIDGAWLQGIAAPPLIHRRVSSLLFHVFYEEVGEGDAAQHHANIYRDLLHAMGESVPQVHTREFAEWPRFHDASFDVPVLWLSLASFPRRFLPEILGLNLAVELAGVGGPYLEARDALRYYGLPTLFVDVHNAADNVAAGHAAWAMKAIVSYLDEVAMREGRESVDHHWHRVWSGLRATLPEVWSIRLAARRLATRMRAFRRARRVPVIFPGG